ncbi:MAG: SRPBCC family protein [Actinomycetota bacterium]
MSPAAIYVRTVIRADLETVWRMTQDTSEHPRWDLRFSRIIPLQQLDGGGYRFRYELRMPLHTILGAGTSIGELRRLDGSRTSALRFTTTDRLSPLGDGRGYWRYVPTDCGTIFSTGYDYDPRWGRLIDQWVIRPLVGWMTAWSFDRLRIWAETGVEPEAWPVFAFWKRGRPRASRCVRIPPHGPAMGDAPASLDTLPSP